MPVTLTKSRKLKDTSTQSGIRAIGIGVYNSTDRIVTTSAGVVSLATQFPTASIARLEVKNNTIKFLETGISGGDNRSTGYNGSLTAMFTVPKGAEIETANLVTELCKGEMVLFLEQYDGTIKVAGSRNGALATAPIGDTGATIGDMKGYTITFTTMEPDLCDLYILSGTGITDYASALKSYT
jgi:hypothetical protein